MGELITRDNLKQRYRGNHFINNPIIILFIFISIIIGLFMPLFYKLIFGTNGEALYITTDFSAHIKFVIKGSTDGVFPSYPFYHILLFILSGGSKDMMYLSYLSVLVLTFFTTLKVMFSYYIINKEIQMKWKSVIISLILIFTMPICNWWSNNIYLGQLTPNVWHNPTTIVAMPLAIILFFYTCKKLHTLDLKNYFIISGLVVINLLCKPNYLLAYLPVFIIFLVCKFIKNKDFKVLKGIVIISFSSIAVLICQFLFTYGGNNVSGGIVFAPLAVWGHYSPNVLASLFLSIAFPLVYAIIYFSKVRVNKSIIFSWAIFIVSLLQFTFLAESGVRGLDGNFGWGCFISLYILFLTTAIDFFKQKISPRYLVVLTILSLHLLSGFIYYHRIICGLGFN
mgnify:CR=1 FL=1